MTIDTSGKPGQASGYPAQGEFDAALWERGAALMFPSEHGVTRQIATVANLPPARPLINTSY